MLDTGEISMVNSISPATETTTLAEKIIKMISVQNFPELFYSENMIPLLLFSSLLAISIRHLGSKAEILKAFFQPQQISCIR